MKQEVFEVGDYVRCVQAAQSGNNLEIGKVYRVKRVEKDSSTFTRLRLEEDKLSLNQGWYAYRFEKDEFMNQVKQATDEY